MDYIAGCAAKTVAGGQISSPLGTAFHLSPDLEGPTQVLSKSQRGGHPAPPTTRRESISIYLGSRCVSRILFASDIKLNLHKKVDMIMREASCSSSLSYS